MYSKKGVLYKLHAVWFINRTLWAAPKQGQKYKMSRIYTVKNRFCWKIPDNRDTSWRYFMTSLNQGIVVLLWQINIRVRMGGVSRFFWQVSRSGVDVTLLNKEHFLFISRELISQLHADLSALRPSRVKFAWNFPCFTPFFGVKFWWNFPSHTQTLENLARKISRQISRHLRQRKKRREISLPHFCRVAALTFALTSLNEESRLFFLSDDRIWNFPSLSSLSDNSIGRLWELC